MFKLIRRYVTDEGIDCSGDVGTEAFEQAMMISQKEVPWSDQAQYGKYTVYFGVVVIFIACLKNVWYKYRDYSYKKNQETTVFSSFVDVIVSYFRYLAYKRIPARISYFTSLPPSVGSSLFLFVSSLYLFCYCLVPHFWYRDCSGFGSPPLGVRAGIMATALTPFIYVLSGKSNMISFLTGIAYEKLNVHHQYVGVAAFILSIIHTIPFVYQALREGGTGKLHNLFETDRDYYSGIPPLILLGWLCIASKAYIRNLFYEVFIHLHWVCGIAYFGTLIWHINKTLNCDNYMWGALAFWASQILYRILVKTAFKPNSLFLRPRRAELRKLREGVYELVVTNTKCLNWAPGQHCFLRFVDKRFLYNHPFSINSILSEENSEMKFIIVPKKGLTRRLYNELDERITKNKKVYIDGPYGGTSRDLTSFEKVVLISSGSGVTATLPFLSFLCNNIEKLKNENKRILTQRINFIWIIRHLEDLDWIKKELVRCANIAGDYFDIDIYVSQTSMPLDTKEISKDSFNSDIEKTIETSDDLLRSKNCNIYYYKPSVMRIIDDLQPSLLRRNFFVSSGNESIKIDICRALSRFQSLVFNNDVNNSFVEEIYLHTESFGW